MMDLGVSSFKIEGRLKSPEYVASSAQEYRKAIDRHHASRDLSATELESSRQKMATTYSRGFFPGWLHGVDHQQLVEGSWKSHRGMEIGVVATVEESAMTLDLSTAVVLAPGDGLVWADRDQPNSGGQIYGVKYAGKKRVRVEFGNSVELDHRWLGSRVFLNSVAGQKKRIAQIF